MDKKFKVVLSFGALVVLILVFLFATGTITRLTGKITGGAIVGAGIDDFAKCLSDNGIKMYGAYWCGHCQNQEDLFGGKDVLVSDNVYVECDPRGENNSADLCLSKGITGYPTWEVDGKMYPGEMSLEKLAELSGCKLN